MVAVLLSLSLVAGAAAPAPADPLQQGLQRYREADFESAIPLFQRSVAATPDSDKAGKAKAEIWLGLAFLNIGNADLARSSFRAALLADRSTTLPDEAPPAATPIFANIAADLDRAAVASRPKPEPKLEPKPADVKPTVASNTPPPEVKRPVDVPPADQTDTTSPPDDGAHAETSTHFTVPRWAPEATAGVAAALGVTAGALKLASNSSFDNAQRATLASDASHEASTGDKQQKYARGVAIAAVGTVAIAAVMYFLTE